MVARRDAPLPLAEGVEAEHDEAVPGHGDAEGLEVGPALAVGPPVAGVEQDGRRRAVESLGDVQMGRDRRAGEGVVGHFLDPVSIASKDADDARPQGGRPGQPSGRRATAPAPAGAARACRRHHLRCGTEGSRPGPRRPALEVVEHGHFPAGAIVLPYASSSRRRSSARAAPAKATIKSEIIVPANGDDRRSNMGPAP